MPEIGEGPEKSREYQPEGVSGGEAWEGAKILLNGYQREESLWNKALIGFGTWIKDKIEGEYTNKPTTSLIIFSKSLANIDVWIRWKPCIMISMLLFKLLIIDKYPSKT